MRPEQTWQTAIIDPSNIILTVVLQSWCPRHEWDNVAKRYKLTITQRNGLHDFLDEWLLIQAERQH